MVQFLTCGSVERVHVSYNIWGLMPPTKARCMPTFTSKLLGDTHTFFSRLTPTRISVSIVVAFVARGLSNIPGDIFCYSAVSSAGVVVILPGFTIRQSIPLMSFHLWLFFKICKYTVISALELMSKNIFCGSVRIVYAIIYTLFLVSRLSNNASATFYNPALTRALV